MTPNKLTAKKAPQSAGSESRKSEGSIEPSAPALPALLTRMSTPPNPSIADGDLRVVGHVERQRLGLPAGRPQLVDDGIGRFGADVVDHHDRTRLRERVRDAAAHALPGPGHQGAPAFEIDGKAHRVLFTSCPRYWPCYWAVVS